MTTKNRLSNATFFLTMVSFVITTTLYPISAMADHSRDSYRNNRNNQCLRGQPCNRYDGYDNRHSGFDRSTHDRSTHGRSTHGRNNYNTVIVNNDRDRYRHRNNHNTIIINNGRDRYRHRTYHGVIVYRPYGHAYYGYGSYHSDGSAFKWLAFTAITLSALNLLNENQQRAHEQAQIQATTASLNQPIVWSNGSASGSVVAIRDGRSNGLYCREFQQNITVGGKRQQAYGNACQQADGSWKIVSTN